MSMFQLFMFTALLGVTMAMYGDPTSGENKIYSYNINTLGDVNNKSQWDLQCNASSSLTKINTESGGLQDVTCGNNTLITNTMKTISTKNQNNIFECSSDHVVVGIMTQLPDSYNTTAIRCAKVKENIAISTDNCSTINRTITPYADIKCNITLNEYMVSVTTDAYDGGPVGVKCCKGEETSSPDVTRIHMTTCLEVDPFYTECGASCWSGHLSSSLTIKAIQTNGSSIQEIHCQKNNVTLSLIQVNKFVLQLYPFLVCPPNHLVTAIWSENHADLHLKTIKCNMLLHGQQMTDCQMFDTKSDVAGCDSDDGYYMAGMMLDQDRAVTQVMCCHVNQK